MVNEEKVRLMTKLAIYEEGKGKKILPLASYYRSDYISAQMMKGFISGSIAFACLCGMWLIYGMEQMLGNLFEMDLMQLGMSILIKYLIFMAVYLIITYIVSSYRYAKGKKSIKKYAAMLKKVERMQQREEALKPSAEWES